MPEPLVRVSMGRAGEASRRDAFAAREPYFSVLTSPKFLRANLTVEHEREFFQGGEALIDSLMRTIELRFAPAFAASTYAIAGSKAVKRLLASLCM